MFISKISDFVHVMLHVARGWTTKFEQSFLLFFVIFHLLSVKIKVISH